MEQWERSLQTAMDERFDAAFAELKKSIQPSCSARCQAAGKCSRGS